MPYALQRLGLLLLQAREGRVRIDSRAKNNEGHFWDMGTLLREAAIYFQYVCFLCSPFALRPA